MHFAHPRTSSGPDKALGWAKCVVEIKDEVKRRVDVHIFDKSSLYSHNEKWSYVGFQL